MTSDQEKTPSQISGLALQAKTSPVISRSVSGNEDNKTKVLSEEHVDGESKSQERTPSKISDSPESPQMEPSFETAQEESVDEHEEEAAQLEDETEENVEDTLESGLDEGVETELEDVTLLGSRYSGLGISRQVSPDQFQQRILEAMKKENLFAEVTEAPKKPPTQPDPYEDWTDEDWLKIAARQRASRRSRKKADIVLRKEKYPELYQSDVSIHPSYTDEHLPYYAVARQRYLRALRLMQKQTRGDIEEMALLQPRALDGVRVIRTFCQGAVRDEKKHSLNPKDRRRLEYLLAGNVY